MEFDELRDLWHRNETTLGELKSALQYNRLERSYGGLKRALAIELSIAAVATLLLGSFAGDHLGEPAFVIPGAVLLMYAIFCIVSSIQQLVAARALDYTAPVTMAAHVIARLEMYRSTLNRWTLILAPLMWTPLMIVGMLAIFGIDIYRVAGIGFVLANALFGLAVIPLGMWLARRYAAPLHNLLLQDIAGTSLARARGLLAESDAFAQ